MPQKTVFLSLGANLGEREQTIERAIEALQQAEIKVLARSSLYETEPQDVKDQPWFLNLVVKCETKLFPLQLLALALKVERDLGRVRGAVQRGPRTIDIDILLFGNSVVNTPRLIIPHPRMLERRFVLEPLVEIAPDLRHPATKEPLKKYLAAAKNQQLRIRR
jgi:2-amino-4-hydroxy-6-hydroxymethyldihydropteridine diphosphokinase